MSVTIPTQPIIAIATETPTEPPSWLADAFLSPLAWAIVLTLVGLWLILPRGAGRGRWVGAVCGLVALGLFAWHVPPLVGWLNESVFGILAVTTIVGCGAAISSRNPLYSALWFGLALVGTAGLFLLIGAQFLSVATIAVYAGAILVTFLFVIMLAQPEGHAYYDRLSWDALLSAVTGAILVGMLTSVLGSATSGDSPPTEVAEAEKGAPEKGAPEKGAPATERSHPTDRLAAVSPAAAQISDSDREANILADAHVATFGRELLGRHLISMQAAAALMLAALVGAVALVSHGRQKADD